MTLDGYLARMFRTPSAEGKQHFDLVIFYDRANGIRFPAPEMEAAFLKALGGNAIPAPSAQGVFTPAGQAPRTRLPVDPGNAFDQVERILKNERVNEAGQKMHAVFIIDYAESIFPAGQWGALSNDDRNAIVRLLSWAKDPQMAKNANPIVLVTDYAAQLNEAITSNASRIEQLNILLPGPSERKSYVDYLDAVERQKQKDAGAKVTGLAYEPGFTGQKFSHLTAGLKKLNIEDIKLTARYSGALIGSDVIKQRKNEIYKSEYQSQLEVIEPERGFEIVGGMEWIKEHLRIDVVAPMLAGDFARCPMGILMAGAAGRAKMAVLANAPAYACHMHVVQLNFKSCLQPIVHPNFGKSHAADIASGFGSRKFVAIEGKHFAQKGVF